MKPSGGARTSHDPGGRTRHSFWIPGPGPTLATHTASRAGGITGGIEGAASVAIASSAPDCELSIQTNRWRSSADALRSLSTFASAQSATRVLIALGSPPKPPLRLDHTA